MGSPYAEFPPPPGCLLLCKGLRGAGPVQASPSSVPDVCQCFGVHKCLINDKCEQIEAIFYVFCFNKPLLCNKIKLKLRYEGLGTKSLGPEFDINEVIVCILRLVRH